MVISNYKNVAQLGKHEHNMLPSKVKKCSPKTSHLTSYHRYNTTSWHTNEKNKNNQSQRRKSLKIDSEIIGIFVWLYFQLCIPIFPELTLSFDQTVCLWAEDKKPPNWGTERITQLFHHIHRVLTDVAMFPLFHFTDHCLEMKPMRMMMKIVEK